MKIRYTFTMCLLSIILVLAHLSTGASPNEREDARAIFHHFKFELGQLLCQLCVLSCTMLRRPADLRRLGVEYQEQFPEFADKFDDFVSKLVS